MDKTVKIFNLKTRESFTLKGHSDWVNHVKVDGTASRTCMSASDDTTIKLVCNNPTHNCILSFSALEKKEH